MCHIAGTNKAFTYVLNMEIGKAYFSMALGVSIIPAGEGCKWIKNCRLMKKQWNLNYNVG
jgi:hypothetical protein